MRQPPVSPRLRFDSQRTRSRVTAHREPDDTSRDPPRIFLFFSEATRSPTGLLQNLRPILSIHERVRVRAYTCTYTRGNNRVPATRFPGRRRKGDRDETSRAEPSQDGPGRHGARRGARFETVTGRRSGKRGPTTIRLEKRPHRVPGPSPATNSPG